MKLYAPAFEKRLRRGAKAAIRSTPDLRKEYRRVKKYRFVWKSDMPARILVNLVFLGTLCGMVSHRTDISLPVAWIALWFFEGALFHSAPLAGRLVADPDIMALRLLPVSDDSISRRQFRKAALRFVKTYLDILMAFAAVGLFHGVTRWQWLGIPIIAALTWLVVVSLAALFSIKLPAKTSQGIAMALIFCGFISTNAINFKTTAHPWLIQLAHVIAMVLPTGWTASLFELLAPAPDWRLLIFLAPVALMVCTFKYSLPILWNASSYHEPAQPAARDIHPNLDLAESSGEARRNTGPTEIAEYIASRQFLEPEPWAWQGWMERMLWNLLTPRERVLAEFAFPDGFSMTARESTFFRRLAVAIAAIFIAGHFSAEAQSWVGGIVAFWYLIHLAVGSQRMGSAFYSINDRVVSIPLHALFGIGYWELSRLLLKTMAPRLLFHVSLMILGLLAVSLWFRLPIPTMLLIGFKGAVIMAGGCFWAVVSPFSQYAFDTTWLCYRSFPRAAVIGILFILFGGLTIGGFIVHNEAVAFLLSCISFAPCVALWWIYGLFYNSRQFDLMKVPK